MIIKKLLNTAFQNVPNTMTLPEYVEAVGGGTKAGQVVTVESSKNVHTAYRCINIISDDIAKMPFQTFINRSPGVIERMQPSNRIPVNISWLLEVSPNRNMTPFIFKKTVVQWSLNWGAGYVWYPVPKPGQRPEMFVLPSDVTFPVYDMQGNIWYQTKFSNGETKYIPGVEVFALIINSTDGVTGKSVITYARESLGRRLGASDTQANFYRQGLNPGGIIWMDGAIDKEARKKVRNSYQEAMGGSENAYSLAIFDSKVSKFEQVTMKPIDVQFLQGIEVNDMEIANFFGMPLYKLNMGKQSYESNEQQNLDYLNTTLDPFLVQWEQCAALKWLREDEQNYIYFKFNRDVLLRTDAKTRSDVIAKRIQSGVLTPNEGRQIDDLSAYTGGDRHYFPSNMATIEDDGKLLAASGFKSNDNTGGE